MFIILENNDNADPLKEVKEIMNNLIEDDTQTNKKNVEVMQKIRKVFISLLEANSEGRPMTLEVPIVRKWKDCEMSEGKLKQSDSADVKVISSNDMRQARPFVVIAAVLCKIYKNLVENETRTKRGIFYLDMDMFKNQDFVDRAIDSICAMLNVQMFELGVFATSTGVVAGNLIIHVGDRIIDCVNQQIIPHPSDITSLKSTAEYVLVVEKDAVFQRLVPDETFMSKVLLMTGKGYPEVDRRLLLKKIDDELKLPIYILVAADPDGVAS